MTRENILTISRQKTDRGRTEKQLIFKTLIEVLRIFNSWRNAGGYSKFKTLCENAYTATSLVLTLAASVWTEQWGKEKTRLIISRKIKKLCSFATFNNCTH